MNGFKLFFLGICVFLAGVCIGLGGRHGSTRSGTPKCTLATTPAVRSPQHSATNWSDMAGSPADGSPAQGSTGCKPATGTPTPVAAPISRWMNLVSGLRVEELVSGGTCLGSQFKALHSVGRCL